MIITVLFVLNLEGNNQSVNDLLTQSLTRIRLGNTNDSHDRTVNVGIFSRELIRSTTQDIMRWSVSVLEETEREIHHPTPALIYSIVDISFCSQRVSETSGLVFV